MTIDTILILLAIPLIWLSIAVYKFRKNPKTGFIILCVYIAFGKYFQLTQYEDEIFEPPRYTATLTEIVNSTRYDYEVRIIKKENELYYQVNPFFSKGRHLYRAFLLNSYIPEYIFNELGILIDWSPDCQDDGSYQDKWERPDERKEITILDAETMIKKGKIVI